jgi:hypothetical protein
MHTFYSERKAYVKKHPAYFSSETGKWSNHDVRERFELSKSIAAFRSCSTCDSAPDLRGLVAHVSTARQFGCIGWPGKRERPAQDQGG